MFCSNCGAEASGNFCWKCGAPVENRQGTTEELLADWSREVLYAKLIRNPEVRDLLGRYAAMATKRLSGEEFLALVDKVVPQVVPLEKLAPVLQSMYAKLGVKTGREFSRTFSSPPGTVIVSALCSLARRGQILQQVHQFEDGCLLEAVLPSDMWSFEGALHVTVRESAEGTRVDGATKIKGQLFDWGKSRRCLETLFADIEASPASTTPHG